jgi:hypothetical protein
MIAAIIGITSGLLIILLFGILKQFDKKLIYGLILAGIGCRDTALIIPHYDLFCLSIDFTIGIYLLAQNKLSPLKK